MKDFGLTSQEIDGAAQALAGAVSSYLEGTKTGKGRRTASGFTDAVRGALGRERCSKSLFALVVNRAIALGLVERRTSESGRVYLMPLSRGTVVLSQEVALVEAAKGVRDGPLSWRRPRAAPGLSLPRRSHMP